ncbi:MAG: ester cyclase [Pseudomonadota bacterium]
MSDMMQTAQDFFEACETGKGWEGCKDFCAADASFAAQSGAIADINTLEGYCNWMQGLLGILPDGRYELKGFAWDEARKVALGYAVFHGTHTGEGGPMPATGKATASDYVYSIEMNGDGKVAHMVKIWNDGHALAELGWA